MIPITNCQANRIYNTKQTLEICCSVVFLDHGLLGSMVPYSRKSDPNQFLQPRDPDGVATFAAPRPERPSDPANPELVWAGPDGQCLSDNSPTAPMSCESRTASDPPTLAKRVRHTSTCSIIPKSLPRERCVRLRPCPVSHAPHLTRLRWLSGSGTQAHVA